MLRAAFPRTPNPSSRKSASFPLFLRQHTHTPAPTQQRLAIFQHFYGLLHRSRGSL
ncbi:hypothetical protein [Rubritalea tangerina]|uniref:hypothetical protein n=1 Tax=Rubritalea tangerina TaxID=430798 RepID=UPI0036069196